MGFRIAWLAVSGKSKEEALSSLDLVDSGVRDEANESLISVAGFPNGWTILFLKPFDHPLAEEASILQLSKGCNVIVGHVHEGIMYSSVQSYKDGTLVWSISHNAQEGPYDLQTEGNLPDNFADVRAELVAQQETEDAGRQMVDYIFNIPLDVGKSLCGFQHDRWRYDWGEPHFTEVQDQGL